MLREQILEEGCIIQLTSQNQWMSLSLSTKDKHRIKSIFLERVITGIYTTEASTMNQPSERYDSVVNSMLNPKEFMIFSQGYLSRIYHQDKITHMHINARQLD